MTIIQIVPRLPPAIDGVGDYSIILAQKLRSVFAIDSVFIVCDLDWEGPEVIDGFRVARIAAHTGAALLAALKDLQSACDCTTRQALLQFVCYGYQSRGCPIWLFRGLKEWAGADKNKLHTMFHELDADETPLWNSAFWLHRVQRMIIKEIAAISTSCCTNAAFYRDRLSSWGISRVHLCPTFSNVGEPSANPLFDERNRQVVVFGRPWQRERTYDKGRKYLKFACERSGAKAIVDIGSPIASWDMSSLDGIPIVRLGRLTSNEVSEVLNSSIASFVFYAKALLTKSGVYAASCSHGVITFVANDSGRTMAGEGLIDGLDYLSADEPTQSLSIKEMQRMSDQLFQQYQQRNSTEAAKLFASLVS